MKINRSRIILAGVALLLCLVGFVQFLSVRREQSILRMTEDLSLALQAEPLDSREITPLMRTLLKQAPRSLALLAENHPRLAVDPERQTAHWVYGNGESAKGPKSGIHSLSFQESGLPCTGHAGLTHQLNLTGARFDQDRLVLRLETNSDGPALEFINSDLRPDRAYDAVVQLDATERNYVTFDSLERFVELAD